MVSEAGPDAESVLATAGDGTVWMAWQSWNGGQADILLAPLAQQGAALAPLKISDSPANEWAPSIAADSAT